MGLARTGATSGNGSGDIFLAFSTENAGVAAAPREIHVNMLSNARISALFSATVEATEEAIINALIGLVIALIATAIVAFVGSRIRVS